MLKSLLSLFSNSRPPGQAVAPKAAVVAAAPAPKVSIGLPVYPPVDGGVEVAPVDGVLSTQTELIRRLRLLAGVEASEFDRLYIGVLKTLASYVDMLPASSAGTHKGAGGLFRLCLEIAFYSRQAAEGLIFAGRAGVEMRRELEPRWRYAAFLAGLCCELHRPLGRMVVVTASGNEWPMHSVGIAEWIESQHETRYFIRWSDEGHPFSMGMSSILANKIIPAHAMQYLQAGDAKIIPAMLEAIIDDGAAKNNPLADLIARIRKKVIDRDLLLSPHNYGKFTVGMHLEPHLVDAMRALVGKGVWKINEKKARIWYGKDGMFIVWRTAAKEMRDELSSANVTGVPQDAATIAEVLHKAGMLLADVGSDIYWPIKPPGAEAELIAVRIADPESILIALETPPAPMDANLLVSGQNQTVSQAAPVGATGGVAEVAVATVNSEPSAQSNAGDAPVETLPEQPRKEAEVPVTAPAPTPAKVAEKPAAERAPAKPRQPKILNPGEKLRDGELPTVAEVTPGSLPPEIAARLSKPVRSALEILVEDQRSGALAECAAMVAEGFAIKAQQFAMYGIEATKFIVELHGQEWLYSVASNPRRKLHRVSINGAEVDAVVLKRQAAIDIGFKF
ncbi:MobH family relaxase [Azonexus hydrophilus]|uniref:MobH family relaxase n=1 Tax=Azonexus hydrophilus TaxID=418702 RepID=A0ABZ2XNS0_9RHOO